MATNVAHLALNEDHKRVSFGGEKQIVYDDGVLDDYSLINHTSKHNSSFTSSDALPNKVTVTSEDCELPKPISPPAQLEELNSSISVSLALPSLIKKMENENNENPFRPDESLYHEVDPIVEAYRQRPFPPSPCSSPTPSLPLANGHTTYQTEYKEGFIDQPNVSGYEASTTTTTVVINSNGFSTKNKTSIVTKKTKRNSRTASLAEGRTSTNTTDDVPLIDGTDALPPPNKVEIVHINEKKRKCCFCCCIQ